MTWNLHDGVSGHFFVKTGVKKMDTIIVAIITALSVLLASVAPQLIQIARDQKASEYKAMQRKNLALLLQIKAFYKLEELLEQELADKTNSTVGSVKREFRDKLNEDELTIDSELTSPKRIERQIALLMDNIE